MISSNHYCSETPLYYLKMGKMTWWTWGKGYDEPPTEDCQTLTKASYLLFFAIRFTVMIFILFFLTIVITIFQSYLERLEAAAWSTIVTKAQGDIEPKYCDWFKFLPNGGLRNEGRAVHTPRIFISDLEVGLVEEGEVSRKFKTLQEHVVSGDSSWWTGQGFIPRVINCLVNPCFGHQLSLPVTRFASRVRYMEHLFLIMASIDLRINPSWGSQKPPDHQTDFIRCGSLLQATRPHYLPWQVLTLHGCPSFSRWSCSQLANADAHSATLGILPRPQICPFIHALV